MVTIRYNPFREEGLTRGKPARTTEERSKVKRAFLLGEEPNSQMVQFLVKMNLDQGQSLNWYHLMTGARKKILGRTFADFREMRDEVIRKGHEIFHPAIPADDSVGWIEHGRQEAARLGLQIGDYRKQTERAMVFEQVRVKSLTIHQIKCFESVNIPFHHTNLLVGANARGKSTILQLLALGLRGISKVPFPYSWKNIVKTGSKMGRFTIDVEYRKTLIQLGFEIDQDDTITCIQGQEHIPDLKEHLLLLGYGVNRTVKLEEPPPYKNVEDIATLFGENAYLKHIKMSENFKDVTEHFEAIQSLMNAVFEHADRKNKVNLETCDAESFYFRTPSNPNKAIPIEALSDGFRSTFVWLFDMILRVVQRGGTIENAPTIAGIVLLDEIDLHLHPAWQRTILPGLERLFPNIQFIATTHSPFVVQSVGQEYVNILEFNSQVNQIEVISKTLTSELSYRAVVRELFQIQSPFSDKTEQKMEEFLTMKGALLRDEEIDPAKFIQLVEELARKGVEVEGVIRREIRDLERRTGKEFAL